MNLLKWPIFLLSGEVTGYLIVNIGYFHQLTLFFSQR